MYDMPCNISLFEDNKGRPVSVEAFIDYKGKLVYGVFLRMNSGKKSRIKSFPPSDNLPQIFILLNEHAQKNHWRCVYLDWVLERVDNMGNTFLRALERIIEEELKIKAGKRDAK